jgi:hypothetical protein
MTLSRIGKSLAALAVLALASAPASAGASVASAKRHLVKTENADAVAVCKLAYASAALIEITNAGDYGASVTAEAIHNLTPQVPLTPPGRGLAYLVGARAFLSPPDASQDRDPVTQVVCKSATGDLYRLVFVDVFETFTPATTTGTWSYPKS